MRGLPCAAVARSVSSVAVRRASQKGRDAQHGLAARQIPRYVTWVLDEPAVDLGSIPHAAGRRGGSQEDMPPLEVIRCRRALERPDRGTYLSMRQSPTRNSRIRSLTRYQRIWDRKFCTGVLFPWSTRTRWDSLRAHRRGGRRADSDAERRPSARRCGLQSAPNESEPLF